VAESEVDIVLRCYPRIYFACHRRHIRDAGTGTVLSSHQAGVIDHLDGIEGTSVAELAKHMGVTASTMSLMIDRLERGGYVHRDLNPKDRRRVDVRLTVDGIRVKEQQKVLEPQLVEMLLSRLRPEELDTALRGMELLAVAATDMIESGGVSAFWRQTL